MTAEKLPFLKLVAALFDNGVWARMSPAARTLYPVLLRFSNGHFKPSYPGTTRLLKLTGFKQKTSIRKAREELRRLGLIDYVPGTGRTNTRYHFCFDWASTCAPEALDAPPGVASVPPGGGRAGSSPGAGETPRYNKIHISINNNLHETSSGPSEAEQKQILLQSFSPEQLSRAREECRLAEIPHTKENLEKILYRGEPKRELSWTEIEAMLQQKISSGGVAMIRQAFRAEEGGVVYFADHLPDHLKMLLQNICHKVMFEPEVEQAQDVRRLAWS